MRLFSLALLLLLAGPTHAQAQAPDRFQLQGTVTDSLTGKPVYDCLVEQYDLMGKRWALTPVNSDGHYAMFITADQPFELRIERENGYRELRRVFEAPKGGARTMTMDLRLVPK